MNSHLDVECHEGDILAGKYRLVSPIAEGAMGVVWSAVNTVLGMNVAIKIVHRRVTSPAAARRLLSEAQAGSKLTHRAAVRVFDHGETTQGDPFVVMERLSGESMREKIEREGHLDPVLAVRLLLPIAGALQAAHEHGIVHRDVKPENIVMAVEDGTIQPKLVDFGVARLSWMDSDETAIVGTLGYIPLEQLCGDPIDQRVDVWAFSAVLYEALAGRLPFGAACLGETLFELTQGEAPSLLGVAGVDLPLAKIVAKGLRRSTGERWSDLHELGVALARWLAARGVVDDVSGTSLAMYWLRDAASRHDAAPSSGAPRGRSYSTPALAHGSLTPIRLSRAPGLAKDAGPRRRRATLGWIGLSAGLILALSAASRVRGLPSFVSGSRRAATDDPRGEGIAPAPGPRPMEAIASAPSAMPKARPPSVVPAQSAETPLPPADVPPAESGPTSAPIRASAPAKRAKPRPVDVYEHAGAGQVDAGDGADQPPAYDPL